MNRRFHEVARQQNNINMDRQFFNSNTRQDKEWLKQSKKPDQKLDKTDVNIDRQFFNINTVEEFSYINKNRQIADRNWNQYQYAHSSRNKNIYSDTGKRIYSTSTRIDKEPLNTEKTSFVDRSVKANPYLKVNLGTTRIQTIDTKNTNVKNYKNQKKNKFDPFKIY